MNDTLSFIVQVESVKLSDDFQIDLVYEAHTLWAEIYYNSRLLLKFQGASKDEVLRYVGRVFSAFTPLIEAYEDYALRESEAAQEF